jgi:hypothetical protein
MKRKCILLLLCLWSIALGAQNDQVRCQSNDPFVREQYFKALTIVLGVSDLGKDTGLALEIFSNIVDNYDDGASCYQTGTILLSKGRAEVARRMSERISSNDFSYNGIPVVFNAVFSENNILALSRHAEYSGRSIVSYEIRFLGPYIESFGGAFRENIIRIISPEGRFDEAYDLYLKIKQCM